MKLFRKKMNKKGFSLIELIVVIAILAIIAAVAIPRFAGIQARSEVKADASTGAEIIGAVRIYMTDENITDFTAIPGAGTDTANAIAAVNGGDYMIVPTTPQSGGTWTIGVGDGSTAVGNQTPESGELYISWTPTNNYIATELIQCVTENTAYTLNK